ncbi:hypothetical protein BDW74DRAFT_32243 [Aspergillus multicolor]|uniref:uncharacterized protein n=1 Tax=Aspergillus multicolor TaxID=41759 RepID=UPI003CCCB286
MWLLLVQVSLGLAAIALGAAAQVCNSFPDTVIKDQDDIDALAVDCDTIDGNLVIDSEFSGPFVLPGIANITSIAPLGTSKLFNDPVQITSLELPNLQYLELLELGPLTRIQKLDLPKLESLPILALIVEASLDELEFPALETAGFVAIRGNMTDVRFDALRTVESGLEVVHSARTRQTETSMDISFAALEVAHIISFQGNISSFSLPGFSVLGTDAAEDEVFENPVSIIALDGPAIDVDLPKLSSVNGSLEIMGNIGSLSLPSLKDITQSLRVEAAIPLSLDLPIESVENITLSGAIERISLRSLRSWSFLNVSSNLELDCDAFISGLRSSDNDDVGDVLCGASGEEPKAVEGTGNKTETNEDAETQAEHDDEGLAIREYPHVSFTVATGVVGIIMAHALF